MCACTALSGSRGVLAEHRLTAAAALAVSTSQRRIVAPSRASLAATSGSAAGFVSSTERLLERRERPGEVVGARREHPAFQDVLGHLTAHCRVDQPECCRIRRVAVAAAGHPLAQLVHQHQVALFVCLVQVFPTARVRPLAAHPVPDFAQAEGVRAGIGKARAARAHALQEVLVAVRTPPEIREAKLTGIVSRGRDAGVWFELRASPLSPEGEAQLASRVAAWA